MWQDFIYYCFRYSTIKTANTNTKVWLKSFLNSKSAGGWKALHAGQAEPLLLGLNGQHLYKGPSGQLLHKGPPDTGQIKSVLLVIKSHHQMPLATRTELDTKDQQHLHEWPPFNGPRSRWEAATCCPGCIEKTTF